MTALPDRGRPFDDLVAEMRSGRADDLDWRSGRAFSLVYNAADDELERLQHEVAALYLHDNALNPFAYPSLARMEREVVAIGAELLGGPANAGALTSGGTESIFCAVQVARDYARTERNIDRPNIVTARTAHPAFAKACHYLGVDRIAVDIADDGRADANAMAAAITAQTAMVVVSAPCYPYGVIDPVVEVAAAARDAGALCHVDACLGGWLLPFWAELTPTPPWNLVVDGVTSISADIHKYGYAFKGASIVQYRERSLLKHQFFSFNDWPGGFYGSATTAGTRPAPPIAGAWAVLNFLGRDGLAVKAAVVHETAQRFFAGIESIGDLAMVHPPDMSLGAFTSSAVDVSALGAAMTARGWKLDEQQEGLHLMVSPGHAPIVDTFLADLADCYASVADGAPGPASAAGGYSAPAI